MNSNKIAVIGSNSFSGASFSSYLLKKGYEVFGFSRSPEPNEVFLPYKWSKKESSNFVYNKVDLNYDHEKLIQIIKDSKIKNVVNFAALGMVAQSWEKPEDWYRTNVVGQVKFHDALRKIETIEKYIHVTTPEVYGSTNGWVKENFNFSPSTPYAVSRAACDLHLMSFYKAYDFPVIFTRAANVFGPGQQLYRIIPRAILYSKMNMQLELHGGGLSERSFIHIDDVSSATYSILKKGIHGECYHISTNELISIRDLVKMICETIDVDFNSLVLSSNERLGKDQSYKLDSTKLRNEFKWSEKTFLKDGIEQTVDWIHSNFDILKNLPHNYIHKA